MTLALAKKPAQILVPVMREQRIPAWPRANDERAPKVDYKPLEFALVTEHATDAHFTGYSVPDQPYRLNKSAPEAIQAGVLMLLAIFDIDGPDHAASDEWWADQGENLARLNETIPDLFVYRTRGGYRIVGKLGLPFVIRTAEDAKFWTEAYLAWCAWLWRCFQIKADPVGDWQRLYRLPIVKREGKTVRYESLGDASDVGVWQCFPSVADIEAAKALRRKPSKDKPKGTAKTRPVTNDYTGSGILVRVLQNRGDLGSELQPGMWAIRCPRASEHSSGADFDTSTVVFAPSSAGDQLGWIDCKHTNCGHFDNSLKDWLKCFDQTELDRAREQLGIPVQKPQPKPDNDSYEYTDADAPDAAPFEEHGTEDRSSEQPTAADPLRGLKYLSKVALVGRDQILELAATPVDYVWQDIAVAGTIVLIAGPPAEGKTTLLFLVLAARMNLGEVVPLLARSIQPAPPGMFLVVIEGEHSEASTSRKLVKSLKLLNLGDAGLARLIVVARKAVRLGSPEWLDVTRLVAAGLVSDIALDTIARVAPADANDEREQVALFDAVARTIEAAPEGTAKPLVWAVAHTRKANNGNSDLADVSGSAQRTGQADTVLMIKGEKVDGRTVSTTVTFAKLREDPDDYPMPVTFSITADGLELEDGRSDGKPDDRPVDERILELLEKGPKTKNELEKALKKKRSTLESGISNLFASGSITWTEVDRGGRSWRALMTRCAASVPAPDG